MIEHVIKNRIPVTCLAAIAHVYAQLLVLAVNSDQFRILCSYTLLLQPPVLCTLEDGIDRQVDRY